MSDSFVQNIHTKVKVAFYLPSLRGGGAERVMVTIANGFAAQGYKVDLVLADMVGPYLKEVSPDVGIVNLESKRVVFSLLGLIKYLKREKPQVLYSALRHANVIAVLACRLARVETRLIISERNALPDFKSDGLGAYILKLLMTYTYPLADRVVAVSFGVADDLVSKLNLPRNMIKVIYNPVSVDHILAQIESPTSYEWPSIKSYRIIAAGRLTPQKGFVDLLRAFALFRKNHLASLMILGEGEQRRELEVEAELLGISKDVYLPGFIENPFPLIAKANLFILASYWEGLPNVLIQAMACGIPVVSTNCPFGPGEILEGGKWGILVSPGDINGLTHAMETTLDAPMRPNVFARAIQFNSPKAIKSYMDLISNL
jgi:glycosyltransferase involved in cell wall biosynthesis